VHLAAIKELYREDCVVNVFSFLCGKLIMAPYSLQRAPRDSIWLCVCMATHLRMRRATPSVYLDLWDGRVEMGILRWACWDGRIEMGVLRWACWDDRAKRLPGRLWL